MARNAFGYLRAIANIATEILRRGPALPDLASECFKIVRFAGENRDSVGPAKRQASAAPSPGPTPVTTRQAGPTEYPYHLLCA
jgi:hypothetical protein